MTDGTRSGSRLYTALVLIIMAGTASALFAEGSYEYSNDVTSIPDLFPSDTTDIFSKYWEIIRKGVLPDSEKTASIAEPGISGARTSNGQSRETVPAVQPPSAAVKSTTVPVQPAVPLGPVPPISTAADVPLREMRVRKGDEITITLEGTGWIFLGESLGQTGIVFRKRDLGTARADFTFQARETGEYALLFQRQILSTGTSAKEMVVVSVSESVAAGSTRTPRSAAQPETAVKQSPSAAEPVPGVSPSGTVKSGTAATRATETSADAVNPEPSAAGKPSNAVPAGITLPSSPSEAADRLMTDKKPTEAVKLLEEYIALHPDDQSADFLLFKLAGLYEREPAVRNLKRSVALYRTILSNYPFSLYYETAGQRIEYLNRHFFEIR